MEGDLLQLWDFAYASVAVSMKEINWQMWTTIVIAIATLIASLSTAFFNYKQRKQKIAEYRLEWLNELRKDITQFISSVDIYLRKVLKAQKSKNVDSISNKNDLTEHLKEIVSNKSKVLLMLKPKELPVKTLEDQIERELENSLQGIIQTINDGVSNITIADWIKTSNAVREKRDELVEVTRKLLKIEWEKIKKET